MGAGNLLLVGYFALSMYSLIHAGFGTWHRTANPARTTLWAMGGVFAPWIGLMAVILLKRLLVPGIYPATGLTPMQLDNIQSTIITAVIPGLLILANAAMMSSAIRAPIPSGILAVGSLAFWFYAIVIILGRLGRI